VASQVAVPQSVGLLPSRYLPTSVPYPADRRPVPSSKSLSHCDDNHKTGQGAFLSLNTTTMAKKRKVVVSSP
jgi:hypothetical protein